MHRAFADDPVAQAAAIVGARSADGKEFAPEARQQDRIVADAAGERSFGGNFGDVDALGEIRTRCASSLTNDFALSTPAQIGCCRR